MIFWNYFLTLAVTLIFSKQVTSRKRCDLSLTSKIPCGLERDTSKTGCEAAGCCFDEESPFLSCFYPASHTSFEFSATLGPPAGFGGNHRTYLTLGGEPGRPGSSAIRQCHLGTPKIPCHKFGSPVSRGMCQRLGCCFDEITSTCFKADYRILRVRPNCAPGFRNPPKCEDIDECLSQPCLNGGKCTDQINGFKCQCTEPYFGKYCEQVCPQSRVWCPNGDCQKRAFLCVGNSFCNLDSENGIAGCSKCLSISVLCGSTCFIRNTFCAEQRCSSVGRLECTKCRPSTAFCSGQCYPLPPFCTSHVCKSNGFPECSQCEANYILCNDGFCAAASQSCPVDQQVCTNVVYGAVCP